jgi:hypothetical protein
VLRFSNLPSTSNSTFSHTITVISMLALALFAAGCGQLSEKDAVRVLENSEAGRPKEVFVDLGFLNSRCGQSPRTGKYAVLNKVGVIKIASSGQSMEVFTTKRGDRVFKEVGAKPLETTNYVKVTGQWRCNFRTWAVPVAERELTGVKITPNGSQTYEVIYTWKWKPNPLGQAFQADSPVYRKLNTREQASLNDGELPLDNRYPHVTRLRVQRIDRIWQVVN